MLWCANDALLQVVCSRTVRQTTHSHTHHAPHARSPPVHPMSHNAPMPVMPLLVPHASHALCPPMSRHAPHVPPCTPCAHAPHAGRAAWVPPPCCPGPSHGGTPWQGSFRRCCPGHRGWSPHTGPHSCRRWVLTLLHVGQMGGSGHTVGCMPRFWRNQAVPREHPSPCGTALPH